MRGRGDMLEKLLLEEHKPALLPALADGMKACSVHHVGWRQAGQPFHQALSNTRGVPRCSMAEGEPPARKLGVKQADQPNQQPLHNTAHTIREELGSREEGKKIRFSLLLGRRTQQEKKQICHSKRDNRRMWKSQPQRSPAKSALL